MFDFFLTIFPYLTLGLLLGPFTIKLYFILFLFSQKKNLTNDAIRTIVLISGTIFSQIGGELIWISFIFNHFHILPIYNPVFAKSLGTLFFNIQYLTLILFIRHLSKKNILGKFFDNTLLLLAWILCLTSLIVSVTSYIEKVPSNIINNLQVYSDIYFISLVTAHVLNIIGTKHMLSLQPKILQHQLHIFIKYFIILCLLLDISLTHIIKTPHAEIAILLVLFYSIVITIAFSHCLNKVMGLRFLNFSKTVSTIDPKAKFVIDFGDLLKELSRAGSSDSLQEIIVGFARESLKLPPNYINFYMHYVDDQKDEALKKKQEEIYRLYFPFSPLLSTTMLKEKILVYDEIVFSYFYEGKTSQEKSMKFLNAINADVYLPIFYEGQRVACLVINKDSLGKNKVYSRTQQDELIAFATYLGNIYNLLQSFTINELLKQKSSLKDELYLKRLHIQKYKESIQSFLYNPSLSKVGTLTYKNNVFSYSTPQTKEIIGSQINNEDGTPVRISLNTLIKKIKEKPTAATFSQDIHGKMIVIHAAHNTHNNNITFTLYYPGIIDLINYRLKLLRNPNEWDYLLYLETTKAGQIIDRYYPASNERMTSFKIDILKASLQKRPTLLNLHVDDLLPTVEMFHKLSMLPYLEKIHLHSRAEANDFCNRLFGSNSIVKPIPVQRSILKCLDQEGIIYIHNIHYLSLSHQLKLTEFITQGTFSPNQSKEVHYSEVRLIVSSEKNLKILVQEGLFLSELFDELKKINIILPSLVYISDHELLELTHDISTHQIKKNNYTRLLSLTYEEKDRILQDKPVSWKQLEFYINRLIKEKITRSPIPVQTNQDKILSKAEQLGKHALKNKKIMQSLWKKFNRNQRQIALFLGVNRSSISRRCKEYGLS